MFDIEFKFSKKGHRTSLSSTKIQLAENLFQANMIDYQGDFFSQ